MKSKLILLLIFINLSIPLFCKIDKKDIENSFWISLFNKWVILDKKESTVDGIIIYFGKNNKFYCMLGSLYLDSQKKLIKMNNDDIARYFKGEWRQKKDQIEINYKSHPNKYRKIPLTKEEINTYSKEQKAIIKIKNSEFVFKFPKIFGEKKFKRVITSKNHVDKNIIDLFFSDKKEAPKKYVRTDYDKQTSTLRNMFFLNMVIKKYKKKFDKYPLAKNITELLEIENLHKISGISRERLLEISRDGWGNPLLYKSDGKDFYIAGAGKDGIFNGWQQTGAYDGYTDNYNVDVIIKNAEFVYFPGKERK